jgi:hypothetical protein
MDVMLVRVADTLLVKIKKNKIQILSKICSICQLKYSILRIDILHEIQMLRIYFSHVDEKVKHPFK